MELKGQAESWVGGAFCLSGEHNGRNLWLQGVLPGVQHLKDSASGGELIFEGYLHDRKELSGRLQLNSEEVTDGQLALAAMIRFGAEAFSILRGHFLIAFLDGEHRELLLGHDGMGLHPVYYSRYQQGLVFSSCVLTLSRSPFAGNKPNRLSLARSLLMLYPPESGDTYFEGISRLKPGCYLRVSREGRVSEVQFWQLFPDQYMDVVPEDLNDQFEERFSHAVARNVAQGPSGVLLSGGLDSISVTAVASKMIKSQGGAPLSAFCGITPPGYPDFESEAQIQTSSDLGLSSDRSHAIEWLQGADMIGATIKVSRFFPGPVDYWWAGVHLAFHRRLVDQGVHGVLTGSGGDEWLGIHPAFAADLVSRGQFFKLVSLLLLKARSANLGWRRTIRSTLWQWGVKQVLISSKARKSPTWAADQALRQARNFPYPWFFDDPLLEEQVAMSISEPVYLGQGLKNSKQQYYRSALAQAWQNPTLFWEQERLYQVGKAIGLEYYHPFHDQDLVAWCNQLPPEAFIHGGRSKNMVRPLVDKLLPQTSIGKQRKVMGTKKSFIKDHLQTVLPQYWDPEKVTQLVSLGLVDQRKLPTGSQITSVPFHTQVYLLKLLLVEAWINQHCTN